MSNHLLSEATQALRETEGASELEARSTRARVLSGLHQSRVRRRTRLVFLLPIAASFIAFSAWASSNGQARRAVEIALRWFSPSAPAYVHPNIHARASAPPVPVPVPVPVPALSPPPVPVPAPQPLPRRSVVAHRVEPNDPALTLYRTAHTAHFVDHDPVRALVGWDAYLTAAPNGPFAPEARYNRALSLVRLGRTTEARAALEPFASGAYGSYRKDEAGALLERLGD